MKKAKGRPTKYQEIYAGQAEKVCSLFGADDKKLAEFFKVSKSTINKWKHSYPEFSDSLKKGKDEFDTEHVEQALLKKALGYTRTIYTHTKKGVKKAIYRIIEPDVTAQIFWLKNRQPERWRDVQHREHGGSVGVVHSFKQMKEEDLDDILTNFISARKRKGGGGIRREVSAEFN